jgi:peptidoglycan/LPS O-acetylase OafA/YrhL
VNVFTAALILCCLRTDGWLVRAFCWKPLRWLGRISYGAYVFHDILHNFYRNLVVSLGSQVRFIAAHVNALTIPLALVCTVLISWISFRWFESPFLELKERWTIRH